MTQRLLARAVAMVVIAAGSSFWEIFVSAAWLAWVVNLTAAEWWLSYSGRGSVVRTPTPASMATAAQG